MQMVLTTLRCLCAYMRVYIPNITHSPNLHELSALVEFNITSEASEQDLRNLLAVCSHSPLSQMSRSLTPVGLAESKICLPNSCRA